MNEKSYKPIWALTENKKMFLLQYNTVLEPKFQAQARDSEGSLLEWFLIFTLLIQVKLESSQLAVSCYITRQQN